MPFQPGVNQEVVVDAMTYRITEHPSAPGMPYGQEGRQAVVYQLAAGDDYRALKVFKPRYRVPSLVSLADRLATYAVIPGLRVCRRTVLSARRQRDLLQQYPDLAYAVLMPWIDGPTWTEVLASKREISPEESLNLARSLAEILASMEERGLAHCDLSGANVILPALSQSEPPDHESAIELVDVEQLYGPGLDRPVALPGGSPGYAQKTASNGLWSPDADRFAGAALIAEMLSWCDQRVRSAAWGESFFDPNEMQKEGGRCRLLAGVLRERWGDGVARLFERAWHSESLADCATFGEWLVALPETATSKTSVGVTDGGVSKTVSLLLESARKLEAAGDLVSALAAYEHVLSEAPVNSALHEEVSLIVAQIRRTLSLQSKLDLKAEEARKHEQAGRWQVAAALYEDLLKEKAASSKQRAMYEEGLKRCREEIELAQLFDTAAQMMAQRRWGAAQELLAEVVRRRGEYERDGQQASALLAEVRRRRAPDGPPPRPPRRWNWVLAGVAFLFVVLAIVAFAADPGGIVVRLKATATDAETRVSTSTSASTSGSTQTHTPLPTVTWKPTSADTPIGDPAPAVLPTETPVPTFTSVSATWTPIPTFTSVPRTRTPIPTFTSVPATWTPIPTFTSVPATWTPIPTFTSAPPTWTPVPTSTPRPPSATPIPPTNTPRPTAAVSLTASPNSVSLGQNIAVIWGNLSSTGNDWISLHPVNTPDSSYLSWQYARGESGSLVFVPPSTPGAYEFRLFRNGTKVATSNPFQVANSTSQSGARGRVTGIRRVSDCRWDVYMEATGLQPGSRVQVSDTGHWRKR